jgi:hypothetical protein
LGFDESLLMLLIPMATNSMGGYAHAPSVVSAEADLRPMRPSRFLVGLASLWGLRALLKYIPSASVRPSMPMPFRRSVLARLLVSLREPQPCHRATIGARSSRPYACKYSGVDSYDSCAHRSTLFSPARLSHDSNICSTNFTDDAGR